MSYDLMKFAQSWIVDNKRQSLPEFYILEKENSYMSLIVFKTIATI